jgi:hypothetical protein
MANFTAGIGSALAIAVNGTIDASTTIPVLTSTGQVSNKAILTLAAGDVITLRNNSLIALTLQLAPSLGASIVVEKLN